MQSRVTKAAGNRYCQARLKAAKYNEKLLTRAGAVDYLPGVTEDSLKKYELDITKTQTRLWHLWLTHTQSRN